MIIVGGVNRAESFGLNAADPWTNGINVFDLNNMVWKTQYDPEASAYKTPGVINDYLQDSGELPRYWNYQKVEELFATVFTSGSSSPSPTSSAIPIPSSRPRRSRTSTIVSGVIGGIASLTLIALIAWFVLQRRRKQQIRARERHIYNKPELPPSDTQRGEYNHFLPEQQLRHESNGASVNETFSNTGAEELDGRGVVGVGNPPVNGPRWELPASAER